MVCKGKALVWVIVVAIVLGVVWYFAGPNRKVTSAAEAGAVASMSGEDLNKIMEDNNEKEKYLVIDVRSADEYNAGHVKHAINIPVDELEGRLSEINGWKDKPVVTICNTGKKSAKAADILVKAGFTKVYNAAGVKEFNYTTMTKVTSLLAEETKALLASGKPLYIIDARDAKDYEQGHIAGAVNALKDTIDTVMAEHPIPEGAEVLAYCYVGTRSYDVADKLEKMGYKAFNALDGTTETDYTLVK